MRLRILHPDKRRNRVRLGHRGNPQMFICDPLLLPEFPTPDDVRGIRIRSPGWVEADHAPHEAIFRDHAALVRIVGLHRSPLHLEQVSRPRRHGQLLENPGIERNPVRPDDQTVVTIESLCKSSKGRRILELRRDRWILHHKRLPTIGNLAIVGSPTIKAILKTTIVKDPVRPFGLCRIDEYSDQEADNGNERPPVDVL